MSDKFDPDGLWFATLDVRREGALGQGVSRTFGPFASNRSPTAKRNSVDFYAILHLMGWEPLENPKWFKQEDTPK